RRLPLSVGSHPGRKRHPLVGWPLVTAPCGLDTPSGATLQVAVPTDSCRPFIRGLGHSQSPPCRWLGHGHHPCRWPSHGLVPPFLATFAVKM
ncbi:hypothetical protein B296_00026295, partial [Ensete ventricosum]